MITEGLRDFEIPDKPKFASWPCPIDISRFLNGDTVASVDWVASTGAGVDVTALVLDDLKHTYSTTEIIPWIFSGTPGQEYIATGRVTTSSGARELYSLRWRVIQSQPIGKSVGLDAILAA